MAGESRSPSVPPSGNRVRGLIIVARDQPDLWHQLTQHFVGQNEVRVLLDRRQWERRQRLQTYGPERRKAVRRRPASIETDLRYRSFLLVPHRQEPLRGPLPSSG
ncbi:MAG TPA: hypothetical protein VLG48_07355 [Candidatus Methylomirabilis sp.]|nr:hypothetical protein [Candidatus Methylomirabilis sp.]